MLADELVVTIEASDESLSNICEHGLTLADASPRPRLRRLL
jgi:hypothetical protein